MKQITKLKKTFWASVVIFLLGVISGIFAYPLFLPYLPNIMDVVFDGVLEGSDLNIAKNIFIRNLGASLILLVTGPTLVIPSLILFVNGFFITLVASYAMANGLEPYSITLGLLPHGLFELTALFMSSAGGMRIALEFFSNPGKRRLSAYFAMRDGVKIYVRIVVPLLVLSAFLETYVSSKII